MSEMWDRIASELRSLKIAREEAKRTIFCEPRRLDQIRAAVDQRGMADIITVVADPACPAGQLLIAKGAVGASEGEFAQSLQRRWG